MLRDQKIYCVSLNTLAFLIKINCIVLSTFEMNALEVYF